MKFASTVVDFIALAAMPLTAQQVYSQHSPHGGLEAGTIKALSKEQIDGYLGETNVLTAPQVV